MPKAFVIIQPESIEQPVQRTTYFNLWSHKERGCPIVTGKNSAATVGYDSEEDARLEDNDGGNYVRIAILKVIV